jgi:hypothetical protein
MNPWQLIRRELDGALRSMRYDMARRRMNDDTVLLPIISDDTPEPHSRRQRMALAAGAFLLVSGGVGGYYAVAGELDALLSDGSGPAGLPRVDSSASPRATARSSPTGTPSAAVSAAVATSAPAVVRPRVTPSKHHKPKPTPPVPTPAPTCRCTPPPSPRPSGSPTPSPTPTPTPEPSVTPTTAPTVGQTVPSDAPTGSR